MSAASNSSSARLEEPSSQPDASMEEILASIRRIISEEQSELSADKSPADETPASAELTPPPPQDDGEKTPDREFDEWLADTASGQTRTASEEVDNSQASQTPLPDAPAETLRAEPASDQVAGARESGMRRPSGPAEIPSAAIELLNALPSEEPEASVETVKEAWGKTPEEDDQSRHAMAAPAMPAAPPEQSEAVIHAGPPAEQAGAQADARPDPLEGWPDEELPVNPKLQVVAAADPARVVEPAQAPVQPPASQLAADDGAGGLPAEPQAIQPADPHPNPSAETVADPLEVPLHSDAAEPLLSQMAGADVSASFQALSQSIVMQNSGMIEGAIKEMLRPMLKQWLDDNLPPLVERLVRAEIERVARGG